jgi:hypothetical protein
MQVMSGFNLDNCATKFIRSNTSSHCEIYPACHHSTPIIFFKLKRTSTRLILSLGSFPPNPFQTLSKQKKLEKLLAQMEALLAEE